MKPAKEVKHPSRWSVKYPLDPVNQDQLLKTVYNALFGSDLRDVDSAMVGALADVLGPSTITLRDAVPLPPISPVSPTPTPTPSPSPTSFNVALPSGPPDAYDREMLGLDDDSDASDPNEFLDFGKGFLTGGFKQKGKNQRLVDAAKEDPCWDAVINDFDVMNTTESMASSAERGRILDIVRAGQSKSKVKRSALEKYVIRRWGNVSKNSRTKPPKVHHSTVPARPKSPSVVSQNHGWSSSGIAGDLDRGHK